MSPEKTHYLIFISPILTTCYSLFTSEILNNPTPTELSLIFSTNTYCFDLFSFNLLHPRFSVFVTKPMCFTTHLPIDQPSRVNQLLKPTIPTSWFNLFLIPVQINCSKYPFLPTCVRLRMCYFLLTILTEFVIPIKLALLFETDSPTYSVHGTRTFTFYIRQMLKHTDSFFLTSNMPACLFYVFQIKKTSLPNR